MNFLRCTPFFGRRLALLCGLIFSSFSAGAAPGDEHWDTQFGPVGVNSSLVAITVNGPNVFVGGYFTNAGNVWANYVARYDGTNWYPLNNGVSLPVVALAGDGTNVYAAGIFAQADNTTVNAIARWDGSSWSPLGTGLNNQPTTVKVIGTNLYVGGYFTTAGGVSVNGIAQWNGSNWSALGGGVTGGSAGVGLIETDGHNLFVSGVFTSAGGNSITNLARWDGNTWSALGSGVNGVVSAMCYSGNKLYVGLVNGGSGVTNISVWDGNTWSILATANNLIEDLATDGTNIYAGGLFTLVGGTAANRVASWNGSTWSALGSGVQGFGVGLSLGVYKMAWTANGLYAAGTFNQAGNVGVSDVARWDGANWFALGGNTSKGMTHFNGTVNATQLWGTSLYVGGIFTEAGNVIVNGVARWNGTNWSALGSGLTGKVVNNIAPFADAFALAGGFLYVGGNFTNAGGIDTREIVKWDGANWSAVGSGGADSSVFALVTLGTDVYVGGSFTNIGGVFSPGIAKWTGSSWVGLGGVSGGSLLVNALATDGTNIFAGGSFNSMGGVSATNLARWDGNQWTSVGGGANNRVYSLVYTNGILYAGGNFTSAGGVAASRIARWDGAAWSALGSGVTGSGTPRVAALIFKENDLYVGGLFSTAGGLASSGIAKWNGLAWTNLGSGITVGAVATALAFLDNDLYVGGSFILAGGKPSLYMARWNEQTTFYPPANLNLINSARLPGGQFRFRVAGPSGLGHIIQSSTNLTGWQSILTNLSTPYDFTNAAVVDAPGQFYRAMQVQ